jgi:hypothetical protein
MPSRVPRAMKMVAMHAEGEPLEVEYRCGAGLRVGDTVVPRARTSV